MSKKWWCCKAEFGSHEKGCPNFKGGEKTMTVRELIRDLLLELGKPVLAANIYTDLQDDEEANTPIGIDVDENEIKYVEKIVNEYPSHYALVLERDLTEQTNT